MKRQRKGKPNYAFRALLSELKKRAGKTSKELAAGVGITQQTFTAMSVHLDECRLSDLHELAFLLDVPFEDFVREIQGRSALMRKGS